MSYEPKVYRDNGGDRITVASGGTIVVEAGAAFEVDGEDIQTELKALSGLDAELALFEGITASASEINALDGATATSAEINKLAGVTGGVVTASKAVVVDASEAVDAITITALTATSLALGGITLTSGDVTLVDGLTPGTVAASKAVVVDASKQVDTLGITGVLSGGTLNLTNSGLAGASISGALNNYLSITTSGGLVVNVPCSASV